MTETKKEKNEILIYNDHPVPRTRREFLASGLIGLAGYTILPNVTTLLSKSNLAFAETINCESVPFSAGIPYLCIEGAGGMNIPGNNVIVGFVSGGEYQEDFAPSGYSTTDFIRMGLGPELHPNLPNMIDDRYGLKFHAKSGILKGLDGELNGFMVKGRPIQQMIDGLIFAIRTADDSATNPLNSVYMANKAGAKGELVQLVGDTNSDTGARSTAPSNQIDLTKRPSVIKSFTDSQGLLSLGQKLASTAFLSTAANGGDERIKQFMKNVSAMGRSKLEKFKTLSGVDQIRIALDCSYQDSLKLFERFSAQALNPMNNTAKAQMIQQSFKGTDEKVASVVNLVTDNVAGAGSITVGGCDYHDGTALTGYRKDMEIGRYIGKSIKLAALKGKDLFIHLYTDGGVGGDSGGTQESNAEVAGKVIWTNDSATRSASVVIVYRHDHDGTPLVVEGPNGPKRQIGNYIRAGGVELNANPVSSSTDNLWKAIMLNYLSFQGKTPIDFENIFGRGSLPPDFQKLIRLKSPA